MEGEVLGDGPHKFNEGDRVLCYHGPLLYQATVVSTAMVDRQRKFFVHYNGWNKKWDEWVPGYRLVACNEEGLQMQEELAKANTRSVKGHQASSGLATKTCRPFRSHPEPSLKAGDGSLSDSFSDASTSGMDPDSNSPVTPSSSGKAFKRPAGSSFAVPVKSVGSSSSSSFHGSVRKKARGPGTPPHVFEDVVYNYLMKEAWE